MKKYCFKIPIYGVNVTMVQVESADDVPCIERLLKVVESEKEYVVEILNAIRRGAVNGGETFRNFSHRQMLIIFYQMEDEETRAETYSHEKRHIEDRVMEYFGVKDIESAGLLAGFLGRQFYKFSKL